MPTEKGYVAQKLSKSFYIDNCVMFVNNERELVDFVKRSTKILVDAKMDLRLWTHGPVGEPIGSSERVIYTRIPWGIGFGDRSFWSLHVLCDANQHAYATIIFLRCETNEENMVSFVVSRSRVAPQKEITIPRLELMTVIGFTKNCQKKVVNQEHFLSVDEVQDSRGTLLLLIQEESFPETGDSIHDILTVRDQSSMRRMKAKIIERDDSYAFRYSVL
ncbi:integrase catalytic domain-containing protein [Trichonephila clavipes]|nr:integrase catalytic domain-containing protein [Trichonephila clavipes]